MSSIDQIFSVQTTPYTHLPLAKTHKTSYAAISPTRPSLSQSGKNILITGGGTGVGFAIARGFVEAGAANIILSGRREDVLRGAAEKLKLHKCKGVGGKETNVHVKTVDVTNPTSVAELFKWAREANLPIDVVISNAGKSQESMESVLDVGLERVWQYYDINVRSHFIVAEQLSKQQRNVEERGPVVLLHVTSAAAWHFAISSHVPVYAMTKNAGVMLIQQLALHNPATKLQAISFHPGLIRSEASEAFIEKFAKGSDPFESDELLGHFAVWLASGEAAFLHGRYVQADWDVEELRTGELRKRIDEDPWYLKVGITGIHP